MLAPQALTTSPAFGAPALDFAALATARVTQASDIPATFSGVRASTCDADACTITWSGGEQQRTFAIARFVDGQPQGFTQRITTPPFGTWLTWFDANGAATAGTLLAEGTSPISIWAWEHASGRYAGLVSQPGATFGRWTIDQTGISGFADLQNLRERFPWAARPLTTSTQLTRARAWLRQVEYASTASTYVFLSIEPPVWLWQGPGVQNATVEQQGTGLLYAADFDPDQTLLHLETTIEESATATTIFEHQVNRLGARSAFDLTVTRSVQRSRTLWSGNAQGSGGTDIAVDGPGWRLDAFWDLADGSLITLQARILPNGIWTGAFTGWAQEDQDTPREQGEFLMLPDGTWSATVLLQQSDGSYAELPLALPPEGATARSVE
ncbi:MAG: hypothetical protein D6761_12345 [Candidatus Dadabacteria bacterium]|nr:MAG: hypothetical protein D6761_12345 [Candidatus Dadabacteria bacterium]